MLIRNHDIRLYGGSGVRLSFLPNNTSGRIVMSDIQDGQKPPVKNPEPPIVSTGYGSQLKKFTYDVVMENDSIFMKAIKKQPTKEGVSIWDEDNWVSIIIFVYDIVDEELKHYEIDRYKILGGRFGFRYIVDEDYINKLEYRDTIPAGTKLAWCKSNSEKYRMTGRNLNTLICSLPEVGEDTMWISDSVLEDYSVNQYEVYETSYGKGSILANIHGDENEYKAFPDVGDVIPASGVLFAKIPLDLSVLKKEDFSYIENAMLYTNKGLRSRRPHFSDHTLLKYKGKVVAIDIFHNPKSGESVEEGDLSIQTAKYLTAINLFHKEIVDLYKFYRKNFSDGRINPDTNTLIVESMVVTEEPIKGKVPTITRKKKKSKLDMYTVRITIEHELSPNNGWKFSNNYGHKGVIKITPKKDMPYDENGNVSDICLFSKGFVARTNLGGPYEIYVAASSRQIKKSIIDLLAVKNSKEIDDLLHTEIETVYSYLLEYLSYYNTMQYKIYSGTFQGNNFIKQSRLNTIKEVTIQDKIDILKQIYDRELYIVYNIQEEEKIYDIVNRLEFSKFKLKFVPVYIKDPITNKFVALRSRALIGPMYISMLNKITDSFLGASSFFLNGYGLPTGKSKEDHRYTYKYKQVRGWGESEFRLVAAYGSPLLIQKLMDRSKSIVNHRQFYRNQLIAKGVVSEDLIPNREEDTDVAINIIKGIMESAGTTIETTR